MLTALKNKASHLGLIVLWVGMSTSGFAKLDASTPFAKITTVGVFSWISKAQVSDHNIGDVPFSVQQPKKMVETIMIENNASPKDLGALLIEFRKAGLVVDNRINRKRRYNWIKDIHFHFQHPEGLNFKVKVTGFQTLSFQFVYDEQQEFKYFTFRINEEEIYNLVELDIKGFKSYVCYDTGLVVMGETNEDIIRFY